MVGTVTFSAKWSVYPHTVDAVGTQYAVGVSAIKVNSHSGLGTYGWWGPLPLVQKGQTPPSGYAVHSRYAVCSTQ